MHKQILLFVLFLVGVVAGAQAQTYSVKGQVTDNATREGIPGAYVQADGPAGKATTVTDFDGNYTLAALAPGSYTLTVSFVGFTTQTQKVTVNNRDVVLNIALAEESSVLGEVEVVADIAVERQTPLLHANAAFLARHLNESLGGAVLCVCATRRGTP